MQCFIDEIMTGMYLPHKFQLSSNLLRKRNLRLTMSYLSLGALAQCTLYIIHIILFFDSQDEKTEKVVFETEMRCPMHLLPDVILIKNSSDICFSLFSYDISNTSFLHYIKLRSNGS